MLTLSQLRRNSAVTAAFVLLALLVPASAFAQFGLGLTPMRIDLRATPGGQYSGGLLLSNDSRTAARVRAEMLDFYIDDSGTPQFDPNVAKEAEHSCRQWLTVNPMETEVAHQGQASVRYTIRVPANAPARGFHCAAGFTTLPTAEQKAGMGLRSAVRVVAAFYVVVGAPPIDGEVKSIRLEAVRSAQGSNWEAVVALENRGLIHFRPVGGLEVIDAHGKTLEKAQFSSLPVLPKRTQRFHFPLSTAFTAGGEYRLRALVDIGTGEIQEATAVVSVPSRMP